MFLGISTVQAKRVRHIGVEMKQKIIYGKQSFIINYLLILLRKHHRHLRQAMDSAGSAAEEEKKYQQSVQYSIDQTKAKLEELSADLLSSDFLKGAIDAGGKLIDILDGIVKSGNAIPTVATAIAAAFSFKNVGILELN